MTMGRRALCWVLCSVLGLAAAGWLHAQESFWDAYTAGKEAVSAGRYEEAAAHLKEAIRLHPSPGKRVRLYGTNFVSDYYPYQLLGQAYLGEGKPREAEEALKKALAAGEEPREGIEALLERCRKEEATAATPEPAKPTGQPPPAAPPGEDRGQTQPQEKKRALVHFLSEPTGAELWLDGVLRGQTPLELSLEATGHHQATFKRPDFQTERRDFSLRPGDELTVQVAMAHAEGKVMNEGKPATPPATGELELRVQPKGTEVEIDGASRGTVSGGTMVLALSPGDHRLRLVNAGFEEVRTTVRIQAGIRTLFTWAMMPIPTLKPNLETPAIREKAGTAPGPLALFGSGLVLLAALAGILLWMNRRPAVPSDATTTIGSYQLLERLGGGGMGEVWKARRTRDGLTVALKLPLPAQAQDDAFRRRFLQEAAIGQRLDHPGIVRILDWGDPENRLFLAMEYVEGTTLRAKLDTLSDPMSPTEACSLVREVAAILEFTHAHGVIHRDLKPENILLEGPSERLRIADFGVAKVLEATSFTVTGQVLGTPRYMAPEPLLHLPYSPRSDLYSLGAIFYELLTLRPPFEGEGFLELIQSHQAPDRPRPSHANPAVPPALDTIVLTLLALKPDERYSSAKALGVALDEFLAGQASTPPPTTAVL